MLDYISRIFDVCFRDKGYHKSVVDTTYVVKDLVYSKENIRIVFTCELMENAFDFEICFSSMGKPYSVCEQVERRKMHYQNIGINVIHQSIFEYTNGVWDVASFQNEKEKLLHKNYKLGRSRKLFQESVILYRLLLFPAIERIEQIVNN